MGRLKCNYFTNLIFFNNFIIMIIISKILPYHLINITKSSLKHIIFYINKIKRTKLTLYIIIYFIIFKVGRVIF